MLSAAFALLVGCSVAKSRLDQTFLNHHRLLEPIGYIDPAEAEENYHRQLAGQAILISDNPEPSCWLLFGYVLAGWPYFLALGASAYSWS
jgi:hypothetical protein